jgi:CheY-like chemotaxis protein
MSGKRTATMQTILVVDDEEVVRHVVSRMLKRLGYEVLTAEDGREAVDIYRERADEIVCVIVDFQMPGMNGEQTFQALREIRESVCVILTSGSLEEDMERRFEGQEVAGFIEKPFTAEILERKLNDVLQEA